jgi:hypothetical protein
MPLKPRDLIIDNWNREGIFVKRVRRPAVGWLADQTDERMRAVPSNAAWWSVLGIRGGCVLVPEPLVKFIRKATLEDARRAIEYANKAALRTIGSLFPEAVEAAFLRRRKGNHEP